MRLLKTHLPPLPFVSTLLILTRLDALGTKETIAALIDNPKTYPYYDKLCAQFGDEKKMQNPMKSIEGSIHLVPEG